MISTIFIYLIRIFWCLTSLKCLVQTVRIISLLINNIFFLRVSIFLIKLFTILFPHWFNGNRLRRHLSLHETGPLFTIFRLPFQSFEYSLRIFVSKISFQLNGKWEILVFYITNWFQSPTSFCPRKLIILFTLELIF